MKCVNYYYQENRVASSDSYVVRVENLNCESETLKTTLFIVERESQREIWYQFEQLTKQLAMIWGISGFSFHSSSKSISSSLISTNNWMSRIYF